MKVIQIDLDRERVERMRQSGALLMRSLYTAAVSFVFRELLGTFQLVVRNFILRQPGAEPTSIYPRLFLEAFPVDFPVGSSPEALVRHVKAVTEEVLRNGDAPVHLALNGLLDPSSRARPAWQSGLASTLAGFYGTFMGAPVLERRTLHESMSSLMTGKNQIDVFLNFMRKPPQPTADPTLSDVLRQSKGRYLRQCTGGMRSVFALNVFEQEHTHRLSLDSPFSEAIDQKLLAKIAEFFGA